MAPLIENGNLVKISDRIRFPDDVTVGFIIGTSLDYSFFINIFKKFSSLYNDITNFLIV